MARRQLADIDAEVLQRMGNRTDLTPVQRDFFIQDAYLRVAKMYEHAELQGAGSDILVGGTDTLVLSSVTDLWWPTQVRDTTSGFVLIPEDRDQIDSMLKYQGDPHRFYWYNQKFVFDVNAITGRPITVKYKRKPTALVTVSTLDQIYDLCVIMMAAKIGLETARAWDDALKIRALYKAYEQDNGMVPVHQEMTNDYRTGFVVRMR